MSDTLVQVEHLQQYFPAGGYGKNKKYIQAVDDVSFTIERGETLGLVGESGCGKTTTGRTLLRLYEPTGGRFIYDGDVIFDVEKKIKVDMLPYRKRMQIVFQDPYASLDPRMTVGDIIGEAIDVHKIAANKKERYDIIIEMLRRVGLNSEHANRYPHEFSGGMRQRAMIAMALSCNPKLLIADEPTTALDVTIQAQILKLMNDLKREHGTSILFITHDLGVIAQMADDVAVMYCGQVVEMAPAKTLFTDCEFSHPYTEGLMVSIPRLDTPAGVRLESIPGSVPHPLTLPKGCKFAPRCKYCQQRCLEEEPELVNVTEEQQVRCFYPRKEERRANLK